MLPVVSASLWQKYDFFLHGCDTKRAPLGRGVKLECFFLFNALNPLLKSSTTWNRIQHLGDWNRF